MGEKLPPLALREAVNVPDLKQRDKLVRRLKKIRAKAVLDLNTIRWWNENRTDQPPMDPSFEEALIAWCDGKGPMPEVPE